MNIKNALNNKITLLNALSSRQPMLTKNLKLQSTKTDHLTENLMSKYHLYLKLQSTKTGVANAIFAGQYHLYLKLQSTKTSSYNYSLFL